MVLQYVLQLPQLPLQLLPSLSTSYPGFQVGGPCLTSTAGSEDDVLVMPPSPLGDYEPESIDPEVEEVPAKDALVSVSVKIIGRNQKRSEHKHLCYVILMFRRSTVSGP